MASYFWQGPRLEPVSYTHLDVYKRQAFWQAAAPAFLSNLLSTKPAGLKIRPAGFFYPRWRCTSLRLGRHDPVSSRSQAASSPGNTKRMSSVAHSAPMEMVWQICPTVGSEKR